MNPCLTEEYNVRCVVKNSKVFFELINVFVKRSDVEVHDFKIFNIVLLKIRARVISKRRPGSEIDVTINRGIKTAVSKRKVVDGRAIAANKAGINFAFKMNFTGTLRTSGRGRTFDNLVLTLWTNRTFGIGQFSNRTRVKLNVTTNKQRKIKSSSIIIGVRNSGF